VNYILQNEQILLDVLDLNLYSHVRRVRFVRGNFLYCISADCRKVAAAAVS
jgi:hypothetical protein